MALQIKLSPAGVLCPGSRHAGSRKLRLLQPWTPDEVIPEVGGRTWTDGPAHWTRDRRVPASVSAAEVRAVRSSAMLVMRQLLDAWRSAERLLAATVQGSLERSQVQAQVATLRSLYQGLFVQVRHAQTNRADTGGS